MIALNYIYLSRTHAGGKDQVGLNLLKGLEETGQSGEVMVICYDYSEKYLKEIAPHAELIVLKSHAGSELARILRLYYDNTVRIPKLIKRHSISSILHLSLYNGLFHMKVRTVLIPHDIKQIAHRRIGNDIIPFYKYYYYKVVYHLDFKHADKIIAISDCDKEEIYNYYPHYSSKIHRIYNPVIAPAYRDTVPEIEEGYLLAINLQFHHKNIITLIKAYELIRNRISQKLVLVGSVPERVSYIKDYVKEHGLEEDVIFTGFIEDKEKEELLCHTELYINPTKFEGFGMTAVEAMMLGIPTLISGIPVNREVTKGLCEYYEPAEDAEALAKKIVYCMENPVAKEKLEQIGEQLKEAYHYQKVSREYMKLLHELDKS